MGLISPSLPSIYDYLYPPVSDEDFKRYHAVDRRLYGKLINVLGLDPGESMKVMAFFQWLERVVKDTSFLMKLCDVPSRVLNEVVEEALTCLKCAEADNFTGNDNREIFLIPNLLNRKFTLRYFHENRASAICGITYSLHMVCLRAFDDIVVVQQPNYFVPTPNVLEPVNLDHEIGRVPIINNPIPHVPIDGGIVLESMIPSGNNMEEIGSLNSSRMLTIINPSHVVGGASNIEEIARAATRMVPILNPSYAPSAGGGMLLGLPYVLPNQMVVQYIPPFLGGSAMNLLPPNSIPYGHFSHASSSTGSGVFHPQMLPGPPNYYHEFGDAQAPQAMSMDINELLGNNLNIYNVVKDQENEVPPDDRTVFLTFSKGYPITETEVRDFFTRKFGEDVEAVYMQEVTDDEQALYARLVTRTPSVLEAIVDGGKAKYNINGKHVWARKYVKKPNAKILYVGQTSSPSTPD
ncbi:hypothetical protein HAX54_004926 [Datura stramonium]|uniref:RRM domain-containing protein n=1 Tax=Datura stramonium TaxID=4076 RepID=A0ABS8WT49_DATST|nr:hypothetical protein [Datura stramonium]